MTKTKAAAPKTKVWFGNLIHEYAREEGKSFAEIAAKVPNLQVSQLTRWKKGEWSVIEADRLGDLIRATTSDSQKQASLISAYLMDLTPMEFRPMIDIGMRGQVKNGVNTSDQLAGPWSADIRKKLESLGRAYGKDEDFQRMFESLCGWSRRILKEEASKAG